jgi:signal transduction histidine kinase
MVRDDGKGIAKTVAEFKSSSIGVGIGGMRQRVKEFGGVLRMENTNPGTRVEITIPSGSWLSSVPADVF